MKTITVEVTQEHIDSGHRMSCGKCPIALAMAKHAPEGYFFLIGTSPANLLRFDPFVNALAELTSHIFVETAYLPQVARDFIASFDAFKPVTPFTFEITFYKL